MTQNRVETLAEQLGVPKTQQDVTRALQKPGQAVAYPNYGKVALAATGQGIYYSVSRRFGESPYFVIFDPARKTYSIVANPNANDATGRGVQTGQHMVDLGVSSVVAGSFSQDAFQTLHTLRVNVYSVVTGPVQDALGIYTSGQLTPFNTAAALHPAAPGPYPYQAGGNQGAVVVY